MKKFLLLFHTVKYLKPSQLYYRVYRKMFTPRVTQRFDGNIPSKGKDWTHQTLHQESLLGFESATFLNETRQLNFPYSWNDETPGKLWVYNLHYFEDFLCYGSESKSDFHIDFFNKWIIENPVGEGNGWEPYPISLRLPNVLKAWLGGLELETKHFSSLYEQASFLSNDLEKHLLGNHYFVNLKALLFAGVIFNNKKWLALSTVGLIREIPEQIKQDGGYFELTPMYHALILVDMLDMLNLSKAYPNRIATRLVQLICEKLPEMVRFMDLMSHPDGGVSFFNDSANGIAPTKDTILQYAEKLGIEINLNARDDLIIENLEDSGYLVATNKTTKLIFDAANVGPDYIPGHAHADTLSFEMSIGLERVFVNSGTSQYGLSPQRLLERQTKSHNTVEIDGKDSSQVWSGFRVAKRARVFNRRCETQGQKLIMSASHDGYKTLLGGAIHSRVLELNENTLKVIDDFSGKYESAIARYYFHPSLMVKIEGDKLLVAGSDFNMEASLFGLDAVLASSSWHPKFGLSIPNQCLEIKTKEQKLKLLFKWNKN